MRRRTRWLIGIPVALVVLIVGGTWFFFHVIEGPTAKPFTLDSASTATTVAADGPAATTAGVAGPFTLAGSWTPTSASQLGYRIKETLFGQSHTAVGRTNAITGALSIEGTTVKAASFTVDMKKVSSDDGQRDQYFRGRIMQTSQFPTSTFKLTSPITLPADPTDKAAMDFTATGELTMHGVTKAVTFTIKAQRNGANIEVNGSIPIVFADYDIGNPSGGPARTEDHGILEFVIVFHPAG